MNVAKVNTDTNPELTSRFNIKECPTTYHYCMVVGFTTSHAISAYHH